MKHLLLILLVLLSSCASLKKSIIYGSIAGAAIGAVAGNSLSPDPESRMPNTVMWGSLGTLGGATLGYIFHMDDPENRDLPSMILPSGEAPLTSDKKLKEALVIPADTKKYKVETGPLPTHLKGKVKNPYIIEHVIPERVEELKNGKTITIEAHKAWEVSFE